MNRCSLPGMTTTEKCGEAAYEIAVKYKDGEWRIENKVFDTFQDIDLSTLSSDDLAALNAKSGAIVADKHAGLMIRCRCVSRWRLRMMILPILLRLMRMSLSGILIYRSRRRVPRILC